MQKPENILLRLDWTVIRRLDGLLQGDYRTLFQGFGLELAGLREYQFNDDIRHIDWNVTARLNTPYIREYMEDREITGWFLVDLSPSADFGTSGTLKRNLTIDFVSLLARLLTRHGNSVGAIIYNGKTCRLIPARGGKIQVLRLIREMTVQQHFKKTPPTDLSKMLGMALKGIKRRSALFIVSDFISVPGWEKLLGQLTRQHELVPVLIYDPAEYELPDIGTVTMQDSETGEQMFLDTHDPKFRRRFREIARKKQRDLTETFRRCRAEVLALATNKDMVNEILRFASIRKQQKMMPSSFPANPRSVVKAR
jgi:uncharacterized protein (DUF58 family)